VEDYATLTLGKWLPVTTVVGRARPKGGASCMEGRRPGAILGKGSLGPGLESSRLKVGGQ
jgi:hypothetical protein